MSHHLNRNFAQPPLIRRLVLESPAEQTPVEALAPGWHNAAGQIDTSLRTTDQRKIASDTAEPLFRKRGYTAKQRNTVSLNGEWLANTTMQKALADNAPGAPT